MKKLNEKEKPLNLFEFSRFVKRELWDKKKKFTFYLRKCSPAKIQGDKILVDEIFLKTYNKEEKIAIFYHEEYHKKITTLLKKLFYLIRFFYSKKKRKWQEEFCADSYASKKTSKKIVISELKKGKKLYDEGVVKYDPITHPPIKERIKNIENLE